MLYRLQDSHLYFQDMQSEQQISNTLNYQHQQHQQVPQQQQLRAAIRLSQTMPPSKLRKNLIGLTSLAPQIEDLLLEKVDQPLDIEDADPDHPFLKTEFNRDGDSYRSPYANTYFPESQGYVPTGELRKIEELGNVLFSEYTKLYYGNSAIGSFYVSESGNPNQFSCGFFAKKGLQQKEGQGFSGSWDSFNVVDINLNGDEATFNLASTILIEMDINKAKHGTIDMTGFLKQKKTEKRKIGKERYEDCLVIVGEMIEQLQTIMRQSLEAVYIIRTKETIFSTRYEYTVEYEKQRRSLAEGLRQIHLKS